MDTFIKDFINAMYNKDAVKIMELIKLRILQNMSKTCSQSDTVGYSQQYIDMSNFVRDQYDIISKIENKNEKDFSKLIVNNLEFGSRIYSQKKINFN